MSAHVADLGLEDGFCQLECPESASFFGVDGPRAASEWAVITVWDEEMGCGVGDSTLASPSSRKVLGEVSGQGGLIPWDASEDWCWRGRSRRESGLVASLLLSV